MQRDDKQQKNTPVSDILWRMLIQQISAQRE